MPIEITARHMHATKEIQDYARRKAKKIVEEFPGVEHVHVILDIEKHRNLAEVVVQARSHIRVEAEEATNRMSMSIDIAVDKVEKQLRRLRDKVQDHKAVMKHAALERTKVNDE